MAFGTDESDLSIEVSIRYVLDIERVPLHLHNIISTLVLLLHVHVAGHSVR